MVFQGAFFPTTKTDGSELKRARGAKSSNLYVEGRLRRESTSGVTDIEERATSRVYPSGLATATDWIPTLPAAPVLFTTTTGCLRAFSSEKAKGRADRSETPPGG